MAVNDDDFSPAEIGEAELTKAKAKEVTKTLKSVTQAKPDDDGMVWVKCISENQPWINDKPLEYWKDYRLKLEDAQLLEAKMFVVILQPPKE